MWIKKYIYIYFNFSLRGVKFSFIWGIFLFVHCTVYCLCRALVAKAQGIVGFEGAILSNRNCALRHHLVVKPNLQQKHNTLHCSVLSCFSRSIFRCSYFYLRKGIFFSFMNTYLVQCISSFLFCIFGCEKVILMKQLNR